MRHCQPGYDDGVRLLRPRHDVRRLSTRDLLHLWDTSGTLLRLAPDARHGALVVARRQQYLDEMWRRGVRPTIAPPRADDPAPVRRRGIGAP